MAPAHRRLGWTIRANILFLQGSASARNSRDGVADQRASEANMVSSLEKRVRHLKRGGGMRTTLLTLTLLEALVWALN